MTGFFSFQRFLFVTGAVVLILLTLIPTTGVRSSEPVYYHATIESSINPVTASYLERAVRKAEKDGALALILQLDTPGGLMTSMNEMTGTILNAGVPVIVWIGPAGARAASAGVFLTYASHLASMADGTRLGAAHPVSGSGQSMSETMKEKVTNDAVAQLRSLARKRERNETLADSFVKESTSIIAEEAHERNVVEFIASSIPELIGKVEGITVELSNNREITLPDAPIEEIKMNAREDFLNVLVNPNLVYILMMLGIYGLIYEFAQPGIGLGAAAGGVCLLLALYGMSVLPVSFTGLALISLGVALLILEIFVPSFGILTLGGMTAFGLGSVFLFKTPAFTVSLGLIIGITLATTGFILVAGFFLLGAFNVPVAIGEKTIVGETGVVKKPLETEGKVYVQGAYWQARDEDGALLDEGTKIEVVDRQDDLLIVTPRSRGRSEPSKNV